MTNTVRFIGVALYYSKVFLYGYRQTEKTKTFQASLSNNGLSFYQYDDTASVTMSDGRMEDPGLLDHIRVSRDGNRYVTTYARAVGATVSSLFVAVSHDCVHFHTIGELPGGISAGVVVPNYRFQNQLVMYYGGNGLKVSYSSDLTRWQRAERKYVKRIKDRTIVAAVYAEEEGNYVFYFAQKRRKEKAPFKLFVTLFDRADPTHRIWNKSILIWDERDEFASSDPTPIGLVYHDELLISYWRDREGSVFALTHAFDFVSKKVITPPVEELRVRKHKNNPILIPIQHHTWESDAVFNAAAVYDEEKVHLIYRAVGKGGISMLGYATSKDGISIDERLQHPVYIPSQPFEGAIMHDRCPYPNIFMSGPGGSGGCEDPRLTKIEDRYYLMYVAFDGWSPPRLALSSISETDFKNQNWNWQKPVLVSPPGVVDKSGCILPEKINGKYVIFHRIYPNILIDFVDSLEFPRGKYLKGEYKIGPRKHHWDSRKIGIGATPLKTDDGWLTIYYAVDERDDFRYKMGAMLLDLNNPTKVVARSENPILEPTEYYENHLLKWGVIYPCGAVKLHDTLVVYYGGSDTVLCAATASIKPFLETLKSHGCAPCRYDRLQPMQKVITA